MWRKERCTPQKTMSLQQRENKQTNFVALSTRCHKYKMWPDKPKKHIQLCCSQWKIIFIKESQETLHSLALSVTRNRTTFQVTTGTSTRNWSEDRAIEASVRNLADHCLSPTASIAKPFWRNRRSQKSSLGELVEQLALTRTWCRFVASLLD